MNICVNGGVGVIVQYTTPTIEIRFKSIDPATIIEAKLVAKYAGINVLCLDLSAATVNEKTLSWTLTQEQTATLKLNSTVRVYCDWKLSDGTRGRSKFADFLVVETGYGEVM